ASHAARAMAEAWIARAGAEAEALPAPGFARALAEAGGDPGRIAAEFGADPVAVMRRIALWPGARAGAVVCDGSGRLVFRKPVEGFVLPRHGAGCALWPLYAALTRPMTPVRAVVEMAGRVPRRFAVQAIAVVRHPQGFAGPQVVEAAMLIEPADPGAGPGLPVGPTCRICPRGDCPARAEPSLVSG
ncbi:MAG: DUF2083 domain-containing protein, partial [Rhodobacterales bacterium]|nr:DUF2083 domain-containing protein [Rhodobacterales bacterium]